MQARVLNQQKLELIDEIDKEILLFSESYIVEFGYSPTVREIATHVKRSISSVCKRLKKLTTLGLIRTVYQDESHKLFSVHLPGRDPFFK